jgi:mRNA-degrading endonuclease toxin of MazEF toxin-antitoxin module
MKRGDVVLAKVPHSGGTTPKTRPALVVQGDFYNQRISNLLVATITGNLTRQNDAAHYFIDASTPAGKAAGLHRDSLVSCLNLAVLTSSDVVTKIGQLSKDAMDSIDNCLKAALGLP